MTKTYFATEPDRISYLPQADGTAEVWLRRNIQEVESEDGPMWEADEVQFFTRLSEEEVLSQEDKHFEEPIETTLDDLVEAIDILTGIILEG